MKAVRKYVLIEQKFTKKGTSSIILPEGVKDQEALKYDVVLTLKQMGKECPTDELEIGDKVLINQYAQPTRVNNISGSLTKDDNEIINEAIYSYDDIVGVE